MVSPSDGVIAAAGAATSASREAKRAAAITAANERLVLRLVRVLKGFIPPKECVRL